MQDYFDATDEPSQQIPYMYHYANKPGLSTQRSRLVIAQLFNTSTNGLPGNDDSGKLSILQTSVAQVFSGAMGSYAFFYLAGMYPVPATQQFLLSSPFFPSISFTNPVLNTTTTIKANNFNGNPTDGKSGNVFVKVGIQVTIACITEESQSVTVNGSPYKSNCYLDWDVFTAGSTVVLELTNDIGVTCGSGSALPPSLSTGGYD